tara:strand:+ start:2080 stop:2271 length:192 start_codon:yes stop_codon:yes gene_type:complete
MACRQIVEVYDNLIEQMDEKIDETINITYPRGTGNVIMKNFFVSAVAYTTIVNRRNKLVEGRI